MSSEQLQYHCFPTSSIWCLTPTTDTQTTFTLQYNVNYVVGLTAVNCIGSSEAIVITFTLDKPIKLAAPWSTTIIHVVHSELLSSIYCQWGGH